MSVPRLCNGGGTLLGMRRYSLGSGLGLFYMINYIFLAPESALIFYIESLIIYI